MFGSKSCVDVLRLSYRSPMAQSTEGPAKDDGKEHWAGLASLLQSNQNQQPTSVKSESGRSSSVRPHQDQDPFQFDLSSDHAFIQFIPEQAQPVGIASPARPPARAPVRPVGFGEATLGVRLDAAVIPDGVGSVGGPLVAAQDICHCCDQKRTAGHRWCKTHKGVYDALVRDITSKRKVDQEVYKKEWAAHQLTMKDQVLSAQKVLQFEVDHPECIKGKKRGCFDHIQFWETYSKRTYSKDEAWAKWQDFVEFSRRMERKRGWTVGQSRVKWNWYLSQPACRVPRDMGGEEKGFEQRLLVPKGEFAIIGHSTIEEKALSIVGKRVKSITSDGFQDALADLGTGHSGLSNEFHDGAMAGQVACALGVRASIGNQFVKAGTKPRMVESAHDTYKRVHGDTGSAGPASSQGSNPSGAEVSAGVAVQPSLSPNELNAADVAVQRLPAFRKWEGQANTLRKKIAVDLVAGHFQMRQDPCLP